MQFSIRRFESELPEIPGSRSVAFPEKLPAHFRVDFMMVKV
jgi:hypothetical protein